MKYETLQTLSCVKVLCETTMSCATALPLTEKKGSERSSAVGKINKL